MQTTINSIVFGYVMFGLAIFGTTADNAGLSWELRAVAAFAWPALLAIYVSHEWLGTQKETTP